jgi:hypothetical protein
MFSKLEMMGHESAKVKPIGIRIEFFHVCQYVFLFGFLFAFNLLLVTDSLWH